MEIKAKIYDPETTEFVNNITLIITLMDSVPDQPAFYKILGRIPKQDFQFGYKPYIVEINPKTRVFADFSLHETAGWYSDYNMNFRDYSWIEPEWFANSED